MLSTKSHGDTFPHPPVVDLTAKRDLKIYDVTNRGRAVLKQLCGE